MIESCFVQLVHLLVHRKCSWLTIYIAAVYIYVVVSSIVEAIEAHAQDSFSLPRVDRNIYFCLSRNVFRARGAQHTPMNDIFSA